MTASVTLVLDERGYVMVEGTDAPAAAVMFARTSTAPRPDHQLVNELGIDTRSLDVLDALLRELPGHPREGDR